MPHGLPGTLTEQEQAYYLQGTFFNTAVVQMSEAMAHLLLAIAAAPGLQQELRKAAQASPEDTELLDRVIDETLRVYPLFGVAHRITSADIALGEVAIPAGLGAAVQLSGVPPHRRTGRGRVRPGPVAARASRAPAPHPVRRHREPAVSGPRHRRR